MIGPTIKKYITFRRLIFNLLCWICSKWDALNPCTFEFVALIYIYTYTFPSIDQHERKCTVIHLPVEKHLHCLIDTGHENLLLISSILKFPYINGKLKKEINIKRKTIEFYCFYHFQILISFFLSLSTFLLVSNWNYNLNVDNSNSYGESTNSTCYNPADKLAAQLLPNRGSSFGRISSI